jgi:hypothetical protein
VFGFSWDKMIFMVVEKNEDETYTKFKGTYAISANEFSKEKLPDNIDWLDYLPLTDEFIGFNDQQNIVIYNPVAKTIRDTGAHPKRKMDGTPWASDFYYLEDDSLYFSQHVFHISRLVPWPFPEIYQFRKWYRLDFKTNKVQRIYQPDQFVRIIGRVK